MYDELTRRGYWVTPQVRVGQYRIDMVVEGHHDARLAVECDGDKYHGADKWADDMQRQRDLERADWMFWRCFASAFIRRRKEVLDDLLKTLAERGIEPIGAEGAPRNVHTERRLVSSVIEPANHGELKPVEVIGNAPSSSLVVSPAPSISTREDVPPAESLPHPPIDDDNLFGREQLIFPLVRIEMMAISIQRRLRSTRELPEVEPHRSVERRSSPGSQSLENATSSTPNRSICKNEERVGNPVLEGREDAR